LVRHNFTRRYGSGCGLRGDFQRDLIPCTRVERLRQQVTNETKEQFSKSPVLKHELLNAIMGALDAHNSIGTQALSSEAAQIGLKDIRLNYAELYESLRASPAGLVGMRIVNVKIFREELVP
jgi:hypothetical protein